MNFVIWRYVNSPLIATYCIAFREKWAGYTNENGISTEWSEAHCSSREDYITNDWNEVTLENIDKLP